MTTEIAHVVLFYAVTGVMVGLICASSRDVNAKLLDRPLPELVARLAIFIGAGLIWPLVLWKIMTLPLKGDRDGTA